MKKDIHIRVSEKNYKKLKTDSKRLGITQTEFIETFIEKGKIVIINDLIETQRQLRYIGNNINQLTKKVHEGKLKCVELNSFKEEMRKIWESLNSLTQNPNLKL